MTRGTRGAQPAAAAPFRLLERFRVGKRVADRTRAGRRAGERARAERRAGERTRAALENEVATLSYTNDSLRWVSGTSYGPIADRVDISIQHKLDIDVADGAGCIGAVSIELRQHGGCLLALTFGAGVDESALELWTASLQADSLCPNWSDVDEGIYGWSLGNGSATLDLSDASTWEGHLADSCLSAPPEPSGIITLTRARDGQQITLDLSTLSITGEMHTTGSPTACCPGMDCRPQGYAGGPSVGSGGSAGRPGAAGAPSRAGTNFVD